MVKWKVIGSIPVYACEIRDGSRGRVQGVHTPLPPEMTCGFLIQLVFCTKKKRLWFIGVEVEQETSAPPPKKNPGSAPGHGENFTIFLYISSVSDSQALR